MSVVAVDAPDDPVQRGGQTSQPNDVVGPGPWIRRVADGSSAGSWATIARE